jgi:YmdB-like protein
MNLRRCRHQPRGPQSNTWAVTHALLSASLNDTAQARCGVSDRPSRDYPLPRGGLRPVWSKRTPQTARSARSAGAHTSSACARRCQPVSSERWRIFLPRPSQRRSRSVDHRRLKCQDHRYSRQLREQARHHQPSRVVPERSVCVSGNGRAHRAPGQLPLRRPGRGVTVRPAADGSEVAVINLAGELFMNTGLSLFRIVDLHAEATSEKVAMEHYLNGRVTAVLGTLTHVQTSDAHRHHRQALPHRAPPAVRGRRRSGAPRRGASSPRCRGSSRSSTGIEAFKVLL